MSTCVVAAHQRVAEPGREAFATLGRGAPKLPQSQLVGSMMSSYPAEI